MSESTALKVDAAHSPYGEMGQKYLASGRNVAMRLWEETPVSEPKPAASREYETVGYVISGRAELHLENNQIISLEPGDSWVVPQGASHTYRILEPFTAVEATSPPAQGHDDGK